MKYVKQKIFKMTSLFISRNISHLLNFPLLKWMEKLVSKLEQDALLNAYLAVIAYKGRENRKKFKNTKKLDY